MPLEVKCQVQKWVSVAALLMEQFKRKEYLQDPEKVGNSISGNSGDKQSDKLICLLLLTPAKFAVSLPWPNWIKQTYTFHKNQRKKPAVQKVKPVTPMTQRHSNKTKWKTPVGFPQWARREPWIVFLSRVKLEWQQPALKWSSVLKISFCLTASRSHPLPRANQLTVFYGASYMGH